MMDKENISRSESKFSRYQVEADLSLGNPIDYLKVLWWVFVHPQKIEGYRQANRKEIFALSIWLIVTLTWLPLFLANLAFVPLISLAVLLPWGLTGLFGNQRRSDIALVLQGITFLVGGLATFIMLQELPKFVGFTTVVLIIVIVIQSLINIVVVPLWTGGYTYLNAYIAAVSISIPAASFFSANLTYILNGQQGPVKANPFLFLVVMGIIIGFGYLIYKIAGNDRIEEHSFGSRKILFGLMILNYGVIVFACFFGGWYLFA
jgi:hypothetical protein